MPRHRTPTIPTLGRERDSRLEITSVSDHSVSPTYTGLGSLMSVQERFAVAFSLVSGTLIPVTRARVNVLLTSGLPNSVRAANSWLKWTWLVFKVRQVNQMLSVSVIVRPSRLWNTSPTSKSSKKRPRQTFGARSPSTAGRYMSDISQCQLLPGLERSLWPFDWLDTRDVRHKNAAPAPVRRS